MRTINDFTHRRGWVIETVLVLDCTLGTAVYTLHLRRRPIRSLCFILMVALPLFSLRGFDESRRMQAESLTYFLMSEHAFGGPCLAFHRPVNAHTDR